MSLATKQGAREYVPQTAVYLAGPIDKERLRWGVAEWNLNHVGDSDEVFDGDDLCALPGRLSEFDVPGHHFSHRAGFTYTGPYVGGSCDHGCAHSMPHAAGLNGCVDGFSAWHDDGSDFMRAAVVRDLAGIRAADAVIAWIPREGCHGTILEVGYALGIGKRVVLVFATAELEHSHWFMASAVARSFVSADRDLELAFSLIDPDTLAGRAWMAGSGWKGGAK